MKRYFSFAFLCLCLLVSLIFLLTNKEKQEAPQDKEEEFFTAIDSEVNNAFMTVDEYVRNTLKIYLKDKSAASVSPLSNDGVSGDVIQSRIIYEQFAYGLGIDLENDSYHSEDGLGYYDNYKYKFLAEAEDFYAIPLYILIEGDLSQKTFSYQATSVYDQLPLDLWDIYTETPFFDQANNLTKWLVVFKYPFDHPLPPEKMEVSLILDAIV